MFILHWSSIIICLTNNLNLEKDIRLIFKTIYKILTLLFGFFILFNPENTCKAYIWGPYLLHNVNEGLGEGFHLVWNSMLFTEGLNKRLDFVQVMSRHGWKQAIKQINRQASKPLTCCLIYRYTMYNAVRVHKVFMWWLSDRYWQHVIEPTPIFHMSSYIFMIYLLW